MAPSVRKKPTPASTLPAGTSTSRASTVVSDGIVRLKSCTGTIHEAPDYVLKTYSSVFRDLLGMPSQSGGHPEIQMTDDSATITVFLRTLTCSGASLYYEEAGIPAFGGMDHNSAKVWQNIVAIGEKYDVERLQPMYAAALEAAYANDPTAAFVHFCSQRDYTKAMDYFQHMQDGLDDESLTYLGDDIESLDPAELNGQFVVDMGMYAYRAWVVGWRAAYKTKMDRILSIGPLVTEELHFFAVEVDELREEFNHAVQQMKYEPGWNEARPT